MQPYRRFYRLNVSFDSALTICGLERYRAIKSLQLAAEWKVHVLAMLSGLTFFH